MRISITINFLCILSFHIYSLDSNIKMCKTILPAVLYGSETLSLILREEHRLREFENKVLSTISGPKR
jgi:hypothetical protein